MYLRKPNNRTSLRTRALAALVVGALAVPAAEAVVIMDTDSFTDVLTELVNQPLRVDLFDPSLGTLNSVSVELSASLTSSGDVTNTSANAETFNVATSVILYNGALAAGGLASLPDPFTVFPGGDIATELFVGLASGATAPFGPGTLDTGGLVNVFNSTAAGDLAQFLGVGDFGYDFNTLIGTTIAGGGGNVVASIDTVTSATLQVTYDFTPPTQQVPEPATLALLGLGLAGLGFTRRRRLNP